MLEVASDHRRSPHYVVTPTRATVLALAVKRLLDVSIGIALLAVTLPLTIPIAVAIRIDSPGAALFRPTRIGKHGKPFAMFKFRTMVKGAEDRLQEFAHLNVADGMTKIPDDPRVTRIGKWLRRYSLDELPQILNIIAGHMSLVGPRPHDLNELPASALHGDPRLLMRPGLTGLWQVSARSDPSIANRIHFDKVYVTGWSLLMDAKIIARTIPVVVTGKGGSVQKPMTCPIDGPALLVNGNGGGHSNGHVAGDARRIAEVNASAGSYAYAYGYYASSSNGRAKSDMAPVSALETGASTKDKIS